MTSDAIRLSGVTVNAPDALELARFYAGITGGTAEGEAAWARVTGPGGQIAFQQVADFRPPTWPDREVPMHLHLDFLVDDLAATGARALAAGATRFDSQPNDDHCLVYADPAGHPFCLTLWDGDRAAGHDTAPEGRCRPPGRPEPVPAGRVSEGVVLSRAAARPGAWR